MMDKETLAELARLEEDLTALLPRLSKHKVRELKCMVLKHYQKAFDVRNKPPLYGTLNKGFNSEEVERFLSCVDNPKYHLLFSYQALIGLRIGEATKIRLSDINLSTRELKIFTLKARVLNTMIIPLTLFNETLEWIKANREHITSNQDYLFFANHERSHSKRTEPYLELNYVRKVFRGYIRLAGLDEVYATSDEHNRTPRSLHRLTTHSLRHYAITRFAKATNGNLILTSRFARHLKPDTTLTYIHSDKTELYSYVEQIAKPMNSSPEMTAKSR